MQKVEGCRHQNYKQSSYFQLLLSLIFFFFFVEDRRRSDKSCIHSSLRYVNVSWCFLPFLGQPSSPYNKIYMIKVIKFNKQVFLYHAEHQTYLCHKLTPIPYFMVLLGTVFFAWQTCYFAAKTVYFVYYLINYSKKAFTLLSNRWCLLLRWHTIQSNRIAFVLYIIFTNNNFQDFLCRDKTFSSTESVKLTDDKTCPQYL